MGFFEAVKTVFGKYATFSGRARRKEYWYWNIFVVLITYLIYIPLSLYGSYNDEAFATSLTLIITFIICVGTIVPSIAVSVRRLHDIGKSGWWYFISFIPGIGGIILFVFTLMDSQPGANEYGENPKGINGYNYSK